MPTITVRWPGGERRFDAGDTVTLGRAPECSVVLDGEAVSRRHGTLTHGDRGWEYVDDGSSRGTWLDGTRVSRLLLTRRTTLRLGEGDRAVTVELVPSDDRETVLGESPRLEPEPGETARADGGDHRALPRPGGQLREEPAPETVLAHQRLTVDAEGRSEHFYPGRTVSLGRERCDVVLHEPSVSRRHATVTFEDGAWVLRDAGSAHGTHVAGRRVSELRLRDRTEAVLGAPDAGARVVLAPEGTRPASGRPVRSRPSRAMPVLAAVVALAVLAGVGVAVAAATGRLPGTGPDTDALARSAVRVLAYAEDGSVIRGSGTVVDAERGLILTNAHVAAPRAPGTAVAEGLPQSELPPVPEQLEVLVSPGLDRAAEPRFFAEVVAADGYLDLAVLRVTQTTGGSLVTAADLDDLVEVELGDSDVAAPGTDVTVLGYPSLAPSAASTLTRGVISGSVGDPRLQTNRAWLNMDAQISPGNSGGLAVDGDGLMIGVPTLSWLGDRSGDGAELHALRPINLAAPLLDAARAGQPYQPDHLGQWPDGVEVQDVRLSLQNGREGFESECAEDEQGVHDLQLAVTFEHRTFPQADHHDLLVRVVALPSSSSPSGARLGDEEGLVVGEAYSEAQYPFSADPAGCVTVLLEPEEDLAAGLYQVEVYGGPEYRPLAREVRVLR